MKVIEPGHMYEVSIFDGPQNYWNKIRFFKRVGEGYPGNELPPHDGTNCQEILRVLINRVKYLNKQIPCGENSMIISLLRMCLYLFEQRAARRHGRELVSPVQLIENMPFCETCGHIECKEEHEQRNDRSWHDS